jgi:hypothetical protein
MQLKKFWPLGLVFVIVIGYQAKQVTVSCVAEYREWKQQLTNAIDNFKEVSDNASKMFDQISIVIEKLTDRVEGLERKEASRSEWSMQAVEQVMKQAKTTAPSGQTKTPPKGK